MVDFILKLFSKKEQDISELNTRYGNIASVIGIIANILLFAGKFIFGTISASVSVVADAVNNLSDAGTSVISFISFKISSKPADREHPFGHARFEYIASMIVSFIIIIIGFEFFKTSIDKIINPVETKFSVITLLILILSISVKLWLFYFYKKTAEKINSSILKAASTDSLSDVLATSAVLTSLLIMKITGFNTDGYMGVIVAVLIMISGVKIILEIKNHILGSAPDPEIIEKLTSEAKKHDPIKGVHDLVVHNYGPGRCFASMHVEFDGKDDIYMIHDIVDNIEKEILKNHNINCVIHMDPIETDNTQVLHLRQMVEFIVKEINENFTIHDFRFVPGATHSNLIFDVVVSYETNKTDDEIIKIIEEKIKEVSPSYNAVITIDKG